MTIWNFKYQHKLVAVIHDVGTLCAIIMLASVLTKSCAFSSNTSTDLSSHFFVRMLILSCVGFVQVYVVFTALHVMQMRYSEENSVCPSVCLSVRLSVTRVIPDKTEEKSVQIFILYERTSILVFWEEEWLVGGDPFYLKFWVNQPPLERNRRFSTNNRS